MRFAAIPLAILFAIPALTAVAMDYVNARYGATASIPSGFTATGPEAQNSDGLTFWNKRGSMIIVYGADVPGGNFEAYAEGRFVHARDYDHFSNVEKTITPDWAEISGSSGQQQLRERIMSTCNGRQIIAVQYTAPTMDSGLWSRLKSSLKAGPARSC
ncbi:MAG: hypothetical protein KKH72_04505 [Alphaproteobacteria bacterium]|nr:hypothetical protein [Alphaproteobacteria bacterium]